MYFINIIHLVLINKHWYVLDDNYSCKNKNDYLHLCYKYTNDNILKLFLRKIYEFYFYFILFSNFLSGQFNFITFISLCR